MTLRSPCTHRAALCAATLLLTAGPSAANDSWPRFLGPGGDGRAADADAPLRWSAEQNIRWRAEIPGQGWSSPVVDRGRVYLSAAIAASSAESPDYDLALVILDAASGEVERVQRLMRQEADQAPRIHQKNSHASPTPILEEDRVYVHFGHQGTACTDREGRLLWTNRELRFNPVHGNGGSPIVAGELLIFTCDGGDQAYVAALDKRSGELAWRTPRPVDADKKFSFATPTLVSVDGEPQIIAPGSDAVVALAPDDGRILWQVDYDGYSVIPKPVVGDSRVYVCTGFNTPSLLAIRLGGEGNVTETHVEWTLRRGAPKTPTPVLDRGLLYLVSDDGVALCLEADTGSVVWRGRLRGNYSASPLVIGERIYFTNEEGLTTVVATGGRFEKLAENDLAERTLATPALAEGDLFVRTAEALYRISE